MVLDAILQGAAKTFLHALTGNFMSLLLSLGKLIRDGKEPLGPQDALSPNDDTRAGGNRPDAFVKRVRLGDTPPKVEACLAGRVGIQIDIRGLRQGLDLRGETKSRTVIRVVKRLDAEGVADQKELTFVFIPNAEGEHAAQSVHHVRAVLGVETEQDLGIGAGAEAVSLRFQLLLQFAVVIDLTVEGYAVTPIGRSHGLRTGLAQVDDRETSMSEPDTGIAGDPKPRAVGAPLDHRLADTKQLLLLDRRSGFAVGKNAGYAAHLRASHSVSPIRHSGIRNCAPLPRRPPSCAQRRACHGARSSPECGWLSPGCRNSSTGQ